jgi:hypothetical protein
MTTSTPGAERAPEPLIDLSGFVAGLRWRSRIWLSCAVVGVLLGLAAALLTPSGATAAARIFVVHEESNEGEGAMKTDLAVLETTTVAAEAVRRLGITAPPEQFVGTYVGEVVAANVLGITAKGSDEQQAMDRAQAVADAFITVHVQRVADGAQAEIKFLTDRSSELQRDLDGVNAQLAVATAPNQVQALLDRRAILSDQISDLSQRTQEASLGSPRLVAGTRIIDAPHRTSRSPLVSIAIFTMIGLVLGAGLGVAVAAVVTVVRDRPVLRRDIAAHLGASVIAQLPAPLRGPSRLWKRGKAEEESHRTAATMVRLVRAGSGPVSILELGCAGVAARLAAEIADELAQREPVVLVDDLPGGGLRGTGRPNGRVRIVDGRKFPEGEADPKVRQLAVGSVGPGTPWTDLARLGSEAIIVVRAGSAETAWLHTVARQLADAGIALIGVVLVHPDPRDRSDGTLWDAVHTAIRGRVAGARAGGLVLPDLASLLDVTTRNTIAAGHNGNGATHPPAAANGHAAALGAMERSGGVAVIDDPPGSRGVEHGAIGDEATVVLPRAAPVQPPDQPTLRMEPFPVQRAESEEPEAAVAEPETSEPARPEPEAAEPLTFEKEAAELEESEPEESDATPGEAEAIEASPEGSSAAEEPTPVNTEGPADDVDEAPAESTPQAAPVPRGKRRPRPRLRPPG